MTFLKGEETARYDCYRLYARLLRHRRTPFKRHDCFDFDKYLKEYLRSVSEREIVDAAPLANAILVSAPTSTNHFKTLTVLIMLFQGKCMCDFPKLRFALPELRKRYKSFLGNFLLKKKQF